MLHTISTDFTEKKLQMIVQFRKWSEWSWRIVEHQLTGQSRSFVSLSLGPSVSAIAGTHSLLGPLHSSRDPASAFTCTKRKLFLQNYLCASWNQNFPTLLLFHRLPGCYTPAPPVSLPRSLSLSDACLTWSCLPQLSTLTSFTTTSSPDIPSFRPFSFPTSNIFYG